MVEIAGKKVVLGELSFNDSIAVDSRIPSDENGMPSSTALSKIYALASIKSVDGVVVRPTANDVEWNSTASLFSAMDGFALANAYNEAFPVLVGEALKKRVERSGIAEIAGLMVASKGGVSWDRGLAMTRSEFNEATLGIALAHGHDVDWETLEVRATEAAPARHSK